jgi:hypothetical protein
MKWNKNKRQGCPIEERTQLHKAMMKKKKKTKDTTEGKIGGPYIIICFSVVQWIMGTFIFPLIANQKS